MRYPYGVISDLHLHDWSPFKRIGSDGEINSRLEILLNEILRIGQEVVKAGGDTLVVAGDVFHVRGKLIPSVFNPSAEVFRQKLPALGIKQIYMIPGNHDLEGKDSRSIGNAIRSLINERIMVLEGPTDINDSIVLLPWKENIEDLKRQIEQVASRFDYVRRGQVDLVIHAPIDGVFQHIPDGGLDPEWLASLGWRNVFAGHYHNHKDFGGGVYSIGSIAHHSWGDIGSYPGWLLVDEDKVTFQTSKCPRFVEITPDMDPLDAELAADGNYVRVYTELSSASDLERIRDGFMSTGALGVTVLSQPTKVGVARSSTTVKSGVSIEDNLVSYVDASSYADEDKKMIKKVALEILGEVRAV